MTDVTIACVYRTPKVYGARTARLYTPEYVEKLKRGFERHLPVPHKFVCLTNAPFSDYCIPLKTDWHGWWSKIELFTPGLLNGRVISVDLDTVLLGDLSFLLNHNKRFVMMYDHGAAGPNSCLMYWDSDMSHIYDSFLVKTNELMKRYDHREHGHLRGDQGFIQNIQTNRGIPIDVWQRMVPRNYFVKFSDIKKMDNWKPAFPNARLCWWTGNPKPAEVNHPLVRENWI